MRLGRQSGVWRCRPSDGSIPELSRATGGRQNSSRLVGRTDESVSEFSLEDREGPVRGQKSFITRNESLSQRESYNFAQIKYSPSSKRRPHVWAH